jgi:aminodeoxyfutalosine synthase
MITTAASRIENIRAQLEDDVPLSADDGLFLLERADIHTLGELANSLRERLHGRATYYNINRHVNYTNYCVLRCKFCSFYRPFAKDPADAAADAYELSIDEVVARGQDAYRRGATEVHIVGGLHPRLPFEYYTEMLAALRAACPHLHIKAFTAIEIIHLGRIAKPRLDIATTLERLREAGLGSLPGGGAEIFDERVHAEAFKTKIGEAEWFDVHRTAHELGIFTNATMLYGHVETPAERIQHLIKLRDHQAKSLGSRAAHFNCVVPLSFIPEGSELADLPGPCGLDDLRTLAVCRLMCPNIPHIKAFWPMHSPKLAQISLNWGVDDLDGTIVYYDITKREGGGTTQQQLTVDQLKRLIAEAGGHPVERDTIYRKVQRSEQTWTIEGESWEVEYDPAAPVRRDGVGGTDTTARESANATAEKESGGCCGPTDAQTSAGSHLTSPFIQLQPPDSPTE